ncbi:metallophosphoesterase family protein [Vibrio cholerae]|uniref:metallophosphoesterase family protein n=4 Tax=Gammaproteobacteria TaxID=1236 RepID=UPI0004E3AFCA|nr:metallophosphoesterase family protein [Vibrio cholerae]EGQ9391362.1 metallophosphoesterase [Vibrio cholerae]EGR2311253.1 metallophosphoesterase [Vibrio cholerae]EGR2460822.1 metallophosphoesterase [Vibrio cholerae]EGR3989888.1 metallophosphoesterase [Vibrio cholerae]EGR4369706.1 metallophosphoesterase [Vibrio cholerae]
MKVTVFSDVHGDIYSLETLFKLEYSDCYICLGDLVGYGPHSNKCIDLAIDKCGIDNIIFGNHEEMFINGFPHSGCSDIAKRFFYHSYGNYSNDDRIKLFNSEKILPVPGANSDYILTHTLNNKHIYANTIVDEISGNYLIGHSHIQFFKMINSKFKLINVGSLGQNRQSKNIASYANVYLSDGAIEFKNFFSPKVKLINDMINLGYEPDIMSYYES